MLQTAEPSLQTLYELLLLFLKSDGSDCHGNRFQQVHSGVPQRREETAELSKQTYTAACRKEPGAGPGDWTVASLQWKGGLVPSAAGEQ